MKHVVVLGGGISGLSLVHQLRKHLPAAVRIELIESSSRVGGWIKTKHTPPFLFEAGPRGFRPSRNGAEMLRLVEELGLQDQCIQSSGNSRYIFTHGKIQKAPSTILEFLQWPLAWDVLQAVLRELVVPKTTASDESIYDFISRRFSPVVANRLLDPMVSGIFGGNIRHLSIRSCFGLLWDMEQSHGSIVRAMLFGSSPKSTTLLDGTAHSSFVKTGSKAMSMSFTHGMQTFTDALAAHIEATPHTDIRFNTTVESLSPSSSSAGSTQHGGGVVVRVRDAGASAAETIVADHVFSALPAPRLAPLVQSVAPSAAAALSRLPFTSLGVVTLGFHRNLIQHSGFGYLVPTCENQGILGVIYDSCSFPQQNFDQTNNITRLSVFVGGENHPAVAAMPRAKREALALETVQRHLGVTDAPVHVESTWYEHAIPQYPVGYHADVASLEADLAQAFHASLTVVGNSFYGVGLSDCVHKSTSVALDFAALHRTNAGGSL